MTGSFEAGGRGMLPGAQDRAASEAALIELVVEMVLALEPLEHKQHGTGDAPDANLPGMEGGAGGLEPGPADPEPGQAGSPTRVAQSTQRMLAQLRAVLDREAGQLSGSASTAPRARRRSTRSR